MKSVIMSGDYSRDMWYAINHAKTKSDLRNALYFVCCRLQELESKYDKQFKDIETKFIENNDKRKEEINESN